MSCGDAEPAGDDHSACGEPAQRAAQGCSSNPGACIVGGVMVPVGTDPDMYLPVLPHPQPQISSCSPELSEWQSVVGVT